VLYALCAFDDGSSISWIVCYSLLQVESHSIKSSDLNRMGLFSTERGKRDQSNWSLFNGTWPKFSTERGKRDVANKTVD